MLLNRRASRCAYTVSALGPRGTAPFWPSRHAAWNAFLSPIIVTLKPVHHRRKDFPHVRCFVTSNPGGKAVQDQQHLLAPIWCRRRNSTTEQPDPWVCPDGPRGRALCSDRPRKPTHPQPPSLHTQCAGCTPHPTAAAGAGAAAAETPSHTSSPATTASPNLQSQQMLLNCTSP